MDVRRSSPDSSSLHEADFTETVYQPPPSSSLYGGGSFAAYLLGQINRARPEHAAALVPRLGNILTSAAPCDDEEENMVVDDGHHSLTPSTAGGCRARLCVRHQRMVDSGSANEIQRHIEKLSLPEQTAINQIWSQFASSQGPLRQLILRGLLSICCPSQLSFLSEQLKAECRIDPFGLLPREISLRILGHLDAQSLCRAAQVCAHWRVLADDDTLWRNMCAQHIERKCEKCGWGLPLMEKRRRKVSGGVRAISSAGTITAPRAVSNTALAASLVLPPLPSNAPVPPAPSSARRIVHSQHLPNRRRPPPNGAANPAARAARLAPHPVPPVPSPEQLAAERPLLEMPTEDCRRPAKRARRDSGPGAGASGSPSPSTGSSSVTTNTPSTSRANSPDHANSVTRPWKAVYSERLIIERNWRKGLCSVQVFTGHTDAVTCLQVDENMPHPSFPVMMSGSWDRTVRIWNLESGEVVGVLRGHLRGIRALQFDSSKLITGSMDASLKIWHWRTGECLRTLTGHTDAVLCLTAEKNVLASGAADSTVRVWDFDAGTVHVLRGHREWVNRVVIWSAEDSCKTTPSGPPTILSRVYSKSAANATATSGSPQDSNSHAADTMRLLFSASDDGTVRVWDLARKTCVRILESHVAQVQALQVLTVDISREVSPARFPAESASSHHQSHSNSVNGYFTLSSSNDQQDNTNADYLSPRPSTGGLVSARDVGVGGPQTVYLSPATSAGSPAALPPLRLGSMRPLVFSGSLDNTIKMWDVEQGKCTQTLFGHVQGVWDIAVDKLRISSASHDRTIKIWDTESGRCLHTLVGHRGAVVSLQMTDDRILSGSDDGDIRVWNFNNIAS